MSHAWSRVSPDSHGTHEKFLDLYYTLSDFTWFQSWKQNKTKQKQTNKKQKQFPHLMLLLLLLFCHSPQRTVGILLCAFSQATTIPPSVHFLMFSIQPVFLRPGLVFPFSSPSTVIWTRPSDRRFQCSYIDSFFFLNWASRPSSSDTPTVWRIHTLAFLSFQSTWSILRHTYNSNDSIFFMSLCFKVQLSAP